VFEIKNSYEIRGDITIIFIDRPDGEIVEAIIDTEDLENVKSFNNSWGITKVRENSWIVKGTYRENKIKKNISLSRFIMNSNDSLPVRFVNNNPLDHRKINLTIGYHEVQKIKGNDYINIDRNTVALILRDKQGNEKARTLVDKEDLVAVLDKGTWFAEWHKDFNNYLVHNVTYSYVSDKKVRKKTTLHSFIIGVDNKEPIRHCDGDTLNNCKSNLKVYSQTMINDYEEIDDDTVAIILKDKHGNEKARTLIDKEDLGRVINRGYTWSYFKTKRGEPYAVSNSTEGKIYLHRVIMDTPKGMVTDHKDHNTLDNRKRNLFNATLSENQQNRKGSRKGSKSGIRCVSWDNKNKDWIVNVKGKYICRTKDINEAEKMACEKIKELMPNADN